MNRTYLDHNATTPLRPEARAAMALAMDVVGNPSSVHGEGRAAKAMIERAREQVAALVGCDPGEVVFTSGASEAAAIALQGHVGLGGAGVQFDAAGIEHDCVRSWCTSSLNVDLNGQVDFGDSVGTVALQAANSETGILQTLPHGLGFSDLVQHIGKLPFDFASSGIKLACISAHKFGGPKGVGALIVRNGVQVATLIKGGGQEMGRRAGTENIIGIIGLGAAAKAASADVVAGRWQEIDEFRNILEIALEAGSNKTIFVGKGARRLPNTSCFSAPGWKGETQVMQMDLSGFAISAGSACSSGKVRASHVLRAMGYDDDIASSAIRVSLGLDTTKEHVLRFAQTWLDKRDKHQRRAA
jgi:cysteine desulfurase